MSGRLAGLRRGPLPRAGFVLTAGFLALCVFWLADRHRGRGPGLADFASATWGDGVLLPVQAYALGLLAERLPAPAHPPRLWPATLAGAIAGAAVAATTLLDPDAPPDWTMPAPHHPTAAGLWHCGFIVVAAALFARWWCDPLLRLRIARPVARRQGPLTGPLTGPLAVAFGAAVGYAGLAVRDDWSSATSPATLAALAALALAGAGLLAVLTIALTPAARTRRSRAAPAPSPRP